MAGKRPIRRSVAQRQAARRLRLRSLRTNREAERALLHRFLEEIADPHRAPERPIVSVYGIGGVGKSTLLQWVWEEFEQAEPDHDVVRVQLDIDSDKAGSMRVAEFFWFLRMHVHQQLAEPLLAFDYVYMKYLEKAHEPVPFTDAPIQDFIGRISKRDGALAGLLGGVGQVVQALPVGAVLNAAWAYVRDSAREKKLMAELGIDLAEIDDWTAGDIELLLPQLLAEDLGLLLEEHKKSMLLIIDGYERLNEKTEQAFVEFFAAGLLLDDCFSRRTGMVLLGRERTDWSAYDDPADEHRWNADYIRHLHVRGFSDRHADEYLAAASTFYRQLGLLDVAGALDAHRQAIKQACREHPGGEPTYHPFYLDICLNMVEAKAAAFDPDLHLGLTPKELMNRFFKYMDRDELHMHLVLSLAVHFDWDLVHALQRRGIIAPMTRTAFLEFVDRHSYIVECDRPSCWQFNRLMQQSLMTWLCTVDAVQRQIFKDAAYSALCEYFERGMTSDDIGLRRKSFEHANNMLMHAVRTKLITEEEAYGVFRRWSEAYGGSMLDLRLLWQRSWTWFLGERLGRTHPMTRKGFEAWVGSVEELIARGRDLLDGKSSDD
ncbi:MAG: ATP-binding protein [Zetaproteobacteria bacterium]|nr:MAG: ATP-binding protein [Zetaproteobacteria bacterium]